MSANAQTVVLIHGMWMTPRSWDNWVDHYRDRGYNAIAPGWPGVKDPEKIRAFVRAAREAADRLGPARKAMSGT